MQEYQGLAEKRGQPRVARRSRMAEVELDQVRTARPRLQLLAVEGIAVEVAVDDDVGVSAPV